MLITFIMQVDYGSQVRKKVQMKELPKRNQTMKLTYLGLVDTLKLSVVGVQRDPFTVKGGEKEYYVFLFPCDFSESDETAYDTLLSNGWEH